MDPSFPQLHLIVGCTFCMAQLTGTGCLPLMVAYVEV